MAFKTMENNKHHRTEMNENRILFIGEKLKNGGRGMTFPELAQLANEHVKTKIPMSIRTIERIAFGLENNLPVRSITDVEAIKLPHSSNMTRWRENREKRRVAFNRQKESRDRYNERQKTLKALETVRNKVTTETILTPSMGLPVDLRQALISVKEVMKKHRYLTLEMSVMGDRTVVNLEQQPERSTHQL